MDLLFLLKAAVLVKTALLISFVISEWVNSIPLEGEIPFLLELFLKETNCSLDQLNSNREKIFFGVSPELHELAKQKGYLNTFPMDNLVEGTFHYVKASRIFLINSDYKELFSYYKIPLFPFSFFSSGVSDSFLLIGWVPSLLQQETEHLFYLLNLLKQQGFHGECGRLQYESSIFDSIQISSNRIRFDYHFLNSYVSFSGNAEQSWYLYNRESLPLLPRRFNPYHFISGDTSLGQPQRRIYFLPEGEAIPPQIDDGIIREYVRVSSTLPRPRPLSIRLPNLEMMNNFSLKLGLGTKFLYAADGSHCYLGIGVSQLVFEVPGTYVRESVNYALSTNFYPRPWVKVSSTTGLYGEVGYVFGPEQSFRLGIVFDFLTGKPRIEYSLRFV